MGKTLIDYPASNEWNECLMLPELWGDPVYLFIFFIFLLISSLLLLIRVVIIPREIRFRKEINNLVSRTMEMVSSLSERNLNERRYYEDKLKELTTLIQDKIEQNRKFVAKELHDSVGQNLAFIRLVVSRLISETKYKGLQPEFTRIIGLLDRTIDEVRCISQNLSSRELEEAGLNTALKHLCDLISSETGLKISCNISEAGCNLPYRIEHAIYRIVQEAINNILKHSGATEFSIRLRLVDNSARLIISDNGSGFNLREKRPEYNPMRNLGLLNMQQRVEGFSGKFSIESSENQGTAIIIDIPVEDNND